MKTMPKSSQKKLEYARMYRNKNRAIIIEKQRKYYRENKEMFAKYRANYWEIHKENLLKKKREQYANNPEKYIASVKTYREKNIEKCRERDKNYYYKNVEKRKSYNYARYYGEKHEYILKQKSEYVRRPEVRKHRSEYSNTYSKERRKNDIQFRLGLLLRCRLNDIFRGGGKYGSAVRDLGCSLTELKAYLEQKFEPEMSWKNHGHKGWHIDHVFPLSRFDLSNREQFMRACHYTNLQPLWWQDNLSKFNHI